MMRSGVHPRRVGDADDDAFSGLETGDGLAPGFLARTVQQLVPSRFELFCGELDGADVGHVELDARLRNGAIGRPRLGAEARLRGLPEWPDAEVLGAVDVFAVDVVVTL